MTSVDSTSQDQQAVDFVRWVEERIPFNRVLGITVLEVGEGRARVGLDMSDELIGNFERRSLHGGVISATLDLVGGLSALLASAGRTGTEVNMTDQSAFTHFGTIDLRIDYLRPGVGQKFEAVGFVLRTGNKVAVTRMEFRNDTNELLAVGTGTYTVG